MLGLCEMLQSKFDVIAYGAEIPLLFNQVLAGFIERGGLGVDKIVLSRELPEST